MLKRERHDVILTLIRTELIANQLELAGRLRDLGFSVTQASVSRDLYELGVSKQNGSYVLSKVVDTVGGVRFDTAGDCMIVGRCPSGLASAITVRIDATGIGEIVGTIAGDDTIFIAVKDCETQSLVLDRLENMFR